MLGSASATGTVPGGSFLFPEGTLSLSAPGAMSFVIAGSNDSFFAVSEVTVSITNVSEPGSSPALLVSGLLALFSCRRALLMAG